MADQSAREAAASAQTGTESREATRQQVPRQARRHETRDVDTWPSGAAGGFIVFAAVMMMISGVLNIFGGIAAIFHSGSFVQVVRNYAYGMSALGWGWFHLIMGVVVLAAGIGLITDKMWARVVGVVVVAISMIVNFLYIPYIPIWSIVVIAVDMAVLWALLSPRRRDYA